jgi:subtilisin family serine protease
LVLGRVGAEVPPSSPLTTTSLFVNARLLIRFEPEATPADRARLLARIGGRQVGSIDELGVAVVELADPLGGSKQLDSESLVASAEPDYVVRILEAPEPPQLWTIYAPSVQVSEDPRVAEQWHHTVMRTAQAWRFSRGAGMVIAVIDTGVQCGLADLADRCVAGYDFVNGDDRADDDHGHGTDVASLAVAAAHNGVGGAGVAPDAQVMPLKAMAANGYGSHASIAAAVVWAVRHGARVINLSLGGYYDSATLRGAVAYALAHQVVVVAAAGNDSIGMPTYPAAYPDVLGVAATDRLDGHWLPSNFGDYVDVSAPGAGVATTTLAGWGASSGTSEATPLVSAVAALILSEGPTLSVAEVAERITRSAADLGEPGWDPYFGFGRIDAGGAVTP